MSTKRCRICKEEKPLKAFHARVRSKDGRQGVCTACACAKRTAWREEHGQNPEHKEAARQRTALWREKNPERWRASNKAWADANPERQRAGAHRFHDRNPGYNREYSKAYHEKNAEKVRAGYLARTDRRRETSKAWLKRNPDIGAAYGARRRALQIRAMPPWANRQAILAFYREARRLTKETGVVHHVDHIVPLNHRLVCGLHVETNLQVLTGSANSQKSNHFIVQ